MRREREELWCLWLSLSAGRVCVRYVDAQEGRGKALFMLQVLVLVRLIAPPHSPYPERLLAVVSAVASTGVAACQYLGAFAFPEADGTTTHP